MSVRAQKKDISCSLKEALQKQDVIVSIPYESGQIGSLQAEVYREKGS